MADLERIRWGIPSEAEIASYSPKGSHASFRGRRGVTKVPDYIRFWAKVEVRGMSECWPMNCGMVGCYPSFDSYPAHDWLRRNVLHLKNSHRQVIDHICRNQVCVNPSHLRLVPQRVNLTNGTNFMADKILQQFCIHGHPLFGSNLRVIKSGARKGRRVCITCDHRRTQEYIQRRNRNVC